MFLCVKSSLAGAARVNAYERRCHRGMPNIKSSSKRVLLSQKAAARNKAARSLLKTNIKKFDAAANSGDREAAECAYKSAVKTIDRAATKSLIHKNKAAHRKSAMAKRLNSIASE